MGYGMGLLEIQRFDGKGKLSFEDRPYVIMNDQRVRRPRQDASRYTGGCADTKRSSSMSTARSSIATRLTRTRGSKRSPKHGHEIALPLARSLIGMGGDKLIELGHRRSRSASKENEQISHARSELFREQWLRAVHAARRLARAAAAAARRGLSVRDRERGEGRGADAAARDRRHRRPRARCARRRMTSSTASRLPTSSRRRSRSCPRSARAP